MSRYFRLRPGSDEIVSLRLSTKEKPADTADWRFVQATDEQWRAYEAALKENRQDNYEPKLRLTKDGIAVVPDARPVLRIEADKTEIAADGRDAATLTFTRLDGRSDEMQIALFGRLWRLIFVDAACQKSFATQQSGEYVALSTRDVKLEAPVKILAFD